MLWYCACILLLSFIDQYWSGVHHFALQISQCLQQKRNDKTISFLECGLWNILSIIKKSEGILNKMKRFGDANRQMYHLPIGLYSAGHNGEKELNPWSNGSGYKHCLLLMCKFIKSLTMSCYRSCKAEADVLIMSYDHVLCEISQTSFIFQRQTFSKVIPLYAITA